MTILLGADQFRIPLFVALMTGALSLTACCGDEQADGEDELCVVAEAPGDHQWNSADADEFALQIHPAPSDREERHALLLDALTAHGKMEGNFERYDAPTALDHYRTVLADIHLHRTFDEATEIAVKQFEQYRKELDLKQGDCFDER